MVMASSCPACGCGVAPEPAMHLVQAALAVDDIDRALDAGLLDCALCASCSEACSTRLLAARQQRATALAARERHRARNARLARRKAEHETRRVQAADTAGAGHPVLPPAAAAALARAKAKAGVGNS